MNDDRLSEFFITTQGRVFHMECNWSLLGPFLGASPIVLSGMAMAHLRTGCKNRTRK